MEKNPWSSRDTNKIYFFVIFILLVMLVLRFRYRRQISFVTLSFGWKIHRYHQEKFLFGHCQGCSGFERAIPFVHIYVQDVCCYNTILLFDCSGDELLLTEMIFNGVFNELTVQQCVALLSCFVFEEKVTSNY